MILNLIKFGKFSDKSFEISPNITIFYGENESGKTTIFDALMLAFSVHDKKSAVHIKNIKARYGEDIDYNVNPPVPANIKMHPEAYKNIYAIRESDILFELTDNKKDTKDWEQSIKMKMFSSDIDINKIIAEINNEYTGRSENSVLKRMGRIKTEHNDIVDNLEKLYVTKNSLDIKQENLTNKKNETSILDKKRIDIENLLKEKKSEIEVYKKHLSFKNKENVLKDIDIFFRTDQRLKENNFLSDDKTNELYSLENQINENENSIEYLRGKIEVLETENIINNKSSFNSSSLEKRIEDSIETIDASLPTKKEGGSKTIFLSIFLTVAAISTALVVFTKTPIWFLAIIPTMPLFFMKMNKGSDSSKNETPIINNIKKVLPELEIEVDNLPALRDFLLKELGRITSKNINTNFSDDSLEEMEHEINEKRENNIELKNELKSIFRASFVSSISEYIKKRETYISDYKEADILYKKIMFEASNLGIDDINKFYSEIRRNIDNFSNEGIARNDANEVDISIREREYEKILIDYNKIKELISAYNLDISRLEGELHNTNNIHSEIIDKESNLSKIKESIVNEEKKRDALIVLEKMFGDLNKKNDEVFLSLSKNSKVLYSHITDNAQGSDDISISGFKSDKIIVKDKQNEERPVDYLSSATKDAMYLSIRLSVLSEIHEHGRIILLDDPFITFDHNRTINALMFLKAFSEEKNIPIVLFTKDEYAKNFDDFLIHNL